MALMRAIICCACGIEFHIVTEWDDKLRQTHKFFYCPNGHSQSYTGETEAEKLAKRLEYTQKRLSEECQARETAERKAKRIQKRISSGVCICCKRTFQNVAQHMKSKHPDLGKEKSA